MAQLTGLHAKFTGDSSSMRNAAKLAALETNKLNAKLQESKAKAAAAAASSEGLASALHKLRMETDNAYAGMIRYEKAADLVRRTAQAQSWSQAQLGAELQRLAVHYGVAEQAGFNMSDQIRSARFHTANLSAQFFDIGVMMASGQSPFLLAIQQGSQVSQVMQAAGGSVKASGKMLLEAFTALISPVTLLTVGIIAGVAALGQWALSAIDVQTETAAIKPAVDESKEAVEALTAAIKKMRDERALAAGAFSSQEELDAETAITALTNEKLRLQAELVKQEQAIAAAKYTQYSGQVAIGEAVKDWFYGITAAKEETEAQLAATEDQLAVYRRQIALENEMARQAGIQAANGQARLRQAAFMLSYAEKQRATEEQIAQKALYTKNVFHLLAGETSSVSFYLGEAYGNALNLASVKFNNLLEIGSIMSKLENQKGRGLPTPPADPRTGRTPTSGFVTPAERLWEPAAAGSGGGGGGTNPLEAELEQLQNALKTAAELELQSYIERQELLEQALAQKLLTQQEYASLMEQVEKNHSFAVLQENNKTVTGVLGALGQLFQGSKKIGAAIALANSYVAFTEVLKDPAYIGRPWARFAAAASALSSGLAAVRSIKSASPGGSTSGGGLGGGSTGSSGGGGQQTSTLVNLHLVGDTFGRQQVLKLINAINEATADGARIILR